MELSKLPSPKEIFEKYDLAPKKSLGQNFLFDLNITRKIISRTGNLENLNIIEIGPGPGGLTRAIIESQPKSLSVIEYDDRASQAMQEFDSLVNIVCEDALKVNLKEVAQKPCAVIANLPYNISTKLLTNWLSYSEHFEFFTLMFQKEVADRIAAKPRTKAYGRLSVLCQHLCDIQTLFDIPPEAFTPPPKITSTVLKIIPKKQNSEINLEKLENITRTAFNKRRKMLKSSLKDLIPDTEQKLNNIGIDSKSRPEELSVQDFCNLTKLI